MQFIRNFARRIARYILGFLTKLTLKKHDPLIIAIIGEQTPSLVRETVYGIVSQKYNTRRNLERTDSEFSVPLTIIGILMYPKSPLDWITIFGKTALQSVYIKPYRHAIVIQLRSIDEDIFHYWLKILSPKIILNTGETSPTLSKKSTVINISPNELNNMQSGKITKSLKKLCKNLNIDISKLEEVLKQHPTPKPRINLIAGKNGSLIIDARHYYHPPNIQTVIEMANELPGRKYFYTHVADDYAKIPKEYQIMNTKEKIQPHNHDIFIFRGYKNEFINQIRKLSENDLEI